VPQLFFVEPSKTGFQHITFLAGFLQALSSSAVARRFELNLLASASTLSHLPAALFSSFSRREIPVVDPMARKLVRKSFREFLEVYRVVRVADPDDRVIVSCMLPTALILLEVACLLMRQRRAVFIVLHGELEGLSDSGWDFRRIGTWSKFWAALFSQRSRLNYIVLEEFIRDGLIYRGFASDRVHVVHHIVPAVRLDSGRKSTSTCCVIGFQTRQKGWGAVQRLIAELPSIDFVSIGGGKVTDLRTGVIGSIVGDDGYIAEISRNHFALCMFERGYQLTLSASTLDALAANIRIVGLECPFLRAVKSRFDDVVLFESLEQVIDALKRNAISPDVSYSLEGTPYAIDHIRREVEAIL
jgi:hypothetical protein